VIAIPSSRLSSELLEAIIQSYVLREGTDYGDREVPLETKIVQVKQQIDRGQVIIVFDEDSQSCNLLSLQDFERNQ
jgi:uncharacterized protein YheU (UPF0270 family)